MPGPWTDEVKMTGVADGREEDDVIHNDDSLVHDGHVPKTKISGDRRKRSLDKIDLEAKEESTHSQVIQPQEESEQEDDGDHAVQNQFISSSALPTSKKRPHPEDVSMAASEQAKLDNDKLRLKEVLATVAPEAAQQVLHEMWRVFLFEGYNEEHIAFIIRAGLKNANSTILNRILKDEGVFREHFKYILSRKEGIIEAVLKNATVDQLSKHLPTPVLDLMVEHRVKDAAAKDLVKWLAQGNRLGFRPDDILNESNESVIPNVQIQPAKQNGTNRQASQEYPPILPPRYNVPPSYQDPLLVEQEKSQVARDGAQFHAAEAKKVEYVTKPGKKSDLREDLVCPMCHKQLPTQNGYNFHVWKRVCNDVKQTDGRWACHNCLSCFIGKQGLNYHNLRNVCKQNDAPDSPSEAPRPDQSITFTSPYLSQQLPALQHSKQAPKATPAAILPPRPPMHSAPLSQEQAPGRIIPITLPDASSGAPPQRPPMHTPTLKQPESTQYRMSPSDLPPEKLAALNEELEEEDRKYKQKLEDISKVPEAERAAKLTGYKNANATRKSQIRKAYGVSLRLREKDKMAKQAAEGGSPGPAHLEEFRAAPPSKDPSSSQPSDGVSTLHVSGFSPINAPSTRSSPNGFTSMPTQASEHRLVSANSTERVDSPYSGPYTNIPTRQNPFNQSNTSGYNSGFGILKTTVSSSSMPPMNYQQVQQTNKRRRTSKGRSPTSTGYHSPQSAPALAPTPAAVSTTGSYSSSLAMIHTEDAASKYAKNAKPPISVQRAGKAAAAPKAKTAARSPTSCKVAVILPNQAATSTKDIVYTIVSSSEEDEDDDISTTPVTAATSPNLNVNRKHVPAKESGSTPTSRHENIDRPITSIESPNSTHSNSSIPDRQ